MRFGSLAAVVQHFVAFLFVLCKVAETSEKSRAWLALSARTQCEFQAILSLALCKICLDNIRVQPLSWRLFDQNIDFLRPPASAQTQITGQSVIQVAVGAWRSRKNVKWCEVSRLVKSTKITAAIRRYQMLQYVLEWFRIHSNVITSCDSTLPSLHLEILECWVCFTDIIPVIPCNSQRCWGVSSGAASLVAL